MNLRAVVVDANIARSAGPSVRSPAPECLAVLEAISASSLRVPVSKTLDAEWSKHGSRWFQKWRARMHSRRRITAHPDLRLEEHRGRLRRAAPNAAEAVAKDAHLVSLAIAEAAAVLSADEVMRKLLAGIARATDWYELGAVDWANPTLPAEAVLQWVERGLPHEPPRLLRTWEVSP